MTQYLLQHTEFHVPPGVMRLQPLRLIVHY